jgi:hypothetical protein
LNLQKKVVKIKQLNDRVNELTGQTQIDHIIQSPIRMSDSVVDANVEIL